MLRFDRATTLHLFRPLAKLRNVHRTVGVPILAYNGFEPAEGRTHRSSTGTSLPIFALQMNFLSENGYEVIDLEDVLQVTTLGQTGRKYVAITFEGSYHNFYRHASQILTEHHFRSSLFLITSRVHEYRSSLNGHDFLTWNEVRELHANGIQIGSHTVNHPMLHHGSDSALEYEIGHSKQVIEDHIGETIRRFSYPFAFPEQDQKFLSRLRELLHTHGYVCGVSTVIGTAEAKHDWFFLPRIPVNNDDDMRLFRAKLEGAYNWHHVFQYASQRLTSWRP